MRARLLLALAALAAYGSACMSGFVWDDHAVIEHGRLIGSLRNLPTIFSHDAMFNSDGGAFARIAHVDTYRPLTIASFFFERAAFGRQAWVFHLDSVLIHLAVVLLVFAVGRRRMSETAAFVGALIFAVHPAISEAVHWVNGRSDPLCTLFFFAALYFESSPPLVIACTLAATLCKETAFMLLPPLVFLLPVRRLWPWAIGALLGLACRLGALGHPKLAAGGGQLRHALVRMPLLFFDGLRSLLVPVGQAPPSLFERYRHPSLIFMCIAILVTSALVIVMLWRRDVWGWAIATYLCTMAPVALLTYDEGWYGWGRYLYPSVPALALALASSLAAPFSRVPRVALGVGAIVVVMSASTFLAARDWRNDRAFAQAMIDDHPDSSMGYSELAVVELREGRPTEALADAERALALAPRNYRHWSRAATALMQLGRRNEAYAAAAHALSLSAEDANAHYLTALRLLGERQETEAAAQLLEALRLEPEQEGSWNTLQQALAHLGPSSAFALAIRAAASDAKYAAIAARLR